jgi:aryl-alcohol dehydrogenase-like predicted oxidoreductase
MKRRPRDSREREPHRIVIPTRRQVLSTLVASAAYGACGRPGHDLGGALDGGREPEPPSGSADARGGGASPADARGGGASPDAAGSRAGKTAADRVVLGATGITVSRLAMGSGTHGSGGTSAQTELGVAAFARLLVQSYHEQGLTFWETADQYGSHPHFKEAIRQVGRDKLTILTKSQASTAQEMRADLERYLVELGTDHIDVVLLHAVTSGTWTQDLAGPMEYLEEAKMRGLIRAHGTSCHSLSALRLAARTPWVDVDLARINPARIQMDADPATVISVLREMKAAGKGVVGMKILGVGALANQMDTAIRHAVQLDAIDAFTIGFTSYTQLQQVTGKIAQLSAA